MFSQVPVCPPRVADNIKPVKMASSSDGINLCKILYEQLKEIGLFPALTGGLLYKDGLRKDIDIVLYRHRQQLSEGMPELNYQDVKKALEKAGCIVTHHYGFVTKATWNGFDVDLFNPESQGDENY